MIGLQLPMLAGAGSAAPGPMNWTNLVAALSGATNEQTASVSEAQLFRIEFSGVSVVASGEATCDALINGVSDGNAFVIENATIDFSVADGDVIKFSAVGTGDPGWSFDCVATVKYGAPSFASTLDTFNINLGT